MEDKKKIRNIIELFIAWNGETDPIDTANLDSAVDFVADSIQKESVSDDFKAFEQQYMQDNEGEIVSVYDRHAGLVDGAAWKEQQMMKEARDFAKHFFELGLSVSNSTKVTAPHRTKADVDATMAEIEEKSKAFTEAHKGETAEEILAQMRGEEPVSEDFDSWHEKEWVPFGHSSYTTKDKLKEAFKAGAKWQKEQKPAWSEEDEYCLDGAIETEMYMLDVVNGNQKFDVGNESIKEECTKELNWLKSLRPQSHWKPSDEQMHAFEQVYDWYNNFFAPSETLTSLYNDLKKLKS